MARIAGVDLPRNKHANIALTYIYGIGNPRAARILEQEHLAYSEAIRIVLERNYDMVGRRLVRKAALSS